MAVDSKFAPVVRKLIPLTTMPKRLFEKLCASTTVEQASKGEVLFKEGDSSDDFVYLLNGQIRLEAGGMVMETIEGGGEAARFALAHQIPRKVTAIADSKVRFVRIQARYLYSESEKEQKVDSSGYQVVDNPKESAGDWMTALLRLPVFQQLPASNLQKLLMELETVRYHADDVVIKQGSEGEFYYIIKKGRCALSRKPTATAKEITIAKLKQLDTFGEDALITDEPSQISATMMTDGVLWRVNKQNFLKLIKAPVLSSITLASAEETAGDEFSFIDVRPPDEFDSRHLAESVNIPFFSLPMNVTRLDKDKQNVVVCGNGKTSEAAAFYLIKRGLPATTLEGGLETVDIDLLVVTPGSEKVQAPKATKENISVNGQLTAEELGDPLYLASLEDISVQDAPLGAEFANENEFTVNMPEQSGVVQKSQPSATAQRQEALSTGTDVAQLQSVLDEHVRDLSEQIEALKSVVQELLVIVRQQQE